MIESISPIDGRYSNQVSKLSVFFSESALIKYRVFVEIEYFIALVKYSKIQTLKGFSSEKILALQRLCTSFDAVSAKEIKDIETVTNHDVKSVEYWLKEQFEKMSLGAYKEYIHFGLTSQDINNTAIPLMLKDALEKVYLPKLGVFTDMLFQRIQEWKDVPMLAHTHGQPASPTHMGKEYDVFLSRLNTQINSLKLCTFSAKFGGASGNMNAHKISHPEVDWDDFAVQFVEGLGLKRSFPTTQIDHYDGLSTIMHYLIRINNILKDLCIDSWLYISMGYFRQVPKRNEVGSSAMPHKVNPIDFENAEGNIGISNALWTYMSDKLPVSRLQRDLTDSTILRNLGVPLAHALISVNSLLKGMKKLMLNRKKLNEDLSQNWSVVAEAIQTILKRESYPSPYEALKEFTRGKENLSKEDIATFIRQLNIDERIKEELLKITPHNYTGIKIN